MKKILIPAFLLFTSGTFAQDFCKQIKKEVGDNNTSFTYETPWSEDAPPAVRAMRSYSTSTESEFDNFSLVFYIPCEFGDLLTKTATGEAEKEELKVVVEFEDKTKYTDEHLIITHEKKENGTAARLAYLVMTPTNIKTFTTKKIAKFHLATAEAPVGGEMATAITKYLACLRDLKTVIEPVDPNANIDPRDLGVDK
jgi:hypothetical protein